MSNLTVHVSCPGIDGRERYLGQCHLPAVPRVGDTIRIRPSDEAESSEWRVDRIEWDAAVDGFCRVNLFVVDPPLGDMGDRLAAFEAVAAPLMRWLAANYHPHVTAIVTSTTAELVEGLLTTTTKRPGGAL